MRKCPYCDFNSHEAGERLDQAAYIDALMADLDTELHVFGDRTIQSVFIGGGTPSLFSAESISTLLQGCARRLRLADDIEITMEANPGTFEQERFSGFRQAGVNRLSIGIQSFDADHLQQLGRIHNDDEARTAVDIARQAGFDNINLDLMFALPGQTIQQAIDDIHQACAYEVDHISHYQLTIEPNTLFHKHPPVQPDDDHMWRMQQRCQQTLAAQGYQQYEVSAYAREGRQSRHNLNYWQFGDYIGIGAGAHGKVTDVATDTITRRWKKRQPADYIRSSTQGKALSGNSTIADQDRVFEFMMNALRLKAGVPVDHFTARTGLSYAHLHGACRDIGEDLLQLSPQRISTTAYGYRFLDEILQVFLNS